MDDTTTQLLTLLNVSALKRKRPPTEPVQSLKLNKKKKRVLSDTTQTLISASEPQDTPPVVENDEETPSETNENENEKEDEAAPTPYKIHFSADTTLLTGSVRESVDEGRWVKQIERFSKLGTVSKLTPEHVESLQFPDRVTIPQRLRSPYDTRGTKLSPSQNELRASFLSTLSVYCDLFLTRSEIEHRSITRDAITLHTLNHIFSIRRRILKNNERLSQATKDATTLPADVQDQGFTRPSVLVLLPFRSSAVQWTEAILAHLPSHQIENRTRFMAEYSLPPGAVDKLASADPGTYPRDQIETFKGNVDDNFRVGVKFTKKSVKIFADFYRCDLIIASPLGLRMSIEKERSSDFLSSIEVLVIDQMDVLTMQNWEHVQFVLERLNQLPKESHDADFSRIKPWYLDGLATYLRQSILLSPYETPEMRSLFNRSLKNVAGKIRTEQRWKPIEVPEGVEQKFAKFDCLSPQSEADKRYEYFTTQILPTVLKSAVQSANTLIFVPSSFDFIRVRNYLRKKSDVSVAILSEYSSNQDISRARQAFFSGNKQFLLMSERFHFFRRYRIRGVRNILFYGLPDHPQFYTELLSYPFLDDGVDASDITCRALYCKYDYMRLERIAGSEGAARMVQGS